MIIAFLIISFFALSLIAFARSHKLMNWASIINSVSYITLSIYLYNKLSLPVYYFENRFFFIDALSIFSIFLSSAVFLFSAIYARGYVESLVKTREMNSTNIKLFYLSFNLLSLTVTYCFLSNNLALFWIFIELTTLFCALLIAVLNAKENILAALKYIFITSSAMIFTFLGLILIFTMVHQITGSGSLNLDVLREAAQKFPAKLSVISFTFLLIGFFAKSGIVPFHSWMPHSYSKAPSAISAIMSGAISFAGMYGILRVLPIAKNTQSFNSISLIMIIFGVLSIGIASLTMIARRNVKKLMGFSSVESMGFVLVALALGTKSAIYYALLFLFFHSLTKVLLFLSAGIMHIQYGTIHANKMNDVLKLQRLASIGMVAGSISVIGLPLFPLFLPKLYMLAEIGKFSSLLLFSILIFLLMSASSFVIFLSKMFSNDIILEKANDRFIVPFTMNFAIISLIIILLFSGILYPGLINNFVKAAAGCLV